MSTLSVDLKNFEGKIEGAAEDVLAFLTKAGLKLTSNGPAALAALGVLLGAVEAEMTAAGTGNIQGAIADIKPIWPDVKVFAAQLGIKL